MSLQIRNVSRAWAGGVLCLCSIWEDPNGWNLPDVALLSGIWAGTTPGLWLATWSLVRDFREKVLQWCKKPRALLYTKRTTLIENNRT